MGILMYHHTIYKKLKLNKHNMNDSKDLIIDIIKFGKNKTNTGFRFGELVAHLQKNGYPDMSEQNGALLTNFSLIFLINPIERGDWTKVKPNIIYYLPVDAYFNLLDYEELKLARDDSKAAREEAVKATRIATFAIIISSIFAFIQILTPFLQRLIDN